MAEDDTTCRCAMCVGSGRGSKGVVWSAIVAEEPEVWLPVAGQAVLGDD